MQLIDIGVLKFELGRGGMYAGREPFNRVAR